MNQGLISTLFNSGNDYDLIHTIIHQHEDESSLCYFKTCSKLITPENLFFDTVLIIGQDEGPVTIKAKHFSVFRLLNAERIDTR